MSSIENITVIGAGHGGKAMAAHLALMGFRVTLYNRTDDHIAILRARAESIWKVLKEVPMDSGKSPW